MRHTLYLLLLFLLLTGCGENTLEQSSAPLAPSGLTATPGEGKVTLRWQDNSSDETSFTLYRREETAGTAQVQGEPQGAPGASGDGFTELAAVLPNTTQYGDMSVEPRRRYRYAVGANGDGGASERAVLEDGPVAAANRAPVAKASAVSTKENTPLAISLSGSDPDGDTLTFTVVTEPKHGVLAGNAPTLTYMPNEGYSGEDSFAFTVSDGEATSAPATVTVTIGEVDDAPVAHAQELSTPEDTPLTITLRGSDLKSGTLAFAVVKEPSKGSLSKLDQRTGKVRYTPEENENGTDTFTFTVSDGKATSAEATVTVRLEAVNDAPAADGQELSTPEDTPVTVTLTGSDIESDPLVYAIVKGPSKGSLGVIDQSTGRVLYTPGDNETSMDVFTFTVSDGAATSAEATVTVNLGVVNDAPVAEAQTLTLDEDTAASVTLTAKDPEGDPLTYEVVTQPGHGSLSGEAPDLIYTPEENYNGEDAFTFRANDGKDDSSVVTVSIIVKAVNDAPVAKAQTVTTHEDIAVAVTLTASDVEGDSLSYGIVAQPAHGSLLGSAPNLTYTPNKDYGGVDSFSFKVNDGKDDSNVATVSVAVEAVNDPPVAEAQTLGTDEDTSLGVTLTASDADGDALTYRLEARPANGSLSGEAPELVYTPDENYNGIDGFSFKVNDGSGDSEVIAVSIAVKAVNDAPVAEARTVATDEDTPLDLTLTASDIENDELSYSVVTQPEHGSLSGDGPVLTYTPFDNYNGMDSFTFRVSDGEAYSEVVTVSITIKAVNDAPGALSLSSTTVAENEAAGVLVGLLSTTDADASDSHSYSLVAGEGDDDNASFEVDGNELRSKESFDAESKSSYSVRVQTKDAAGAAYAQRFAVTVEDVDEGFVALHVATGYFHTCAVGSDGRVHCWGVNNYGQLGNGSTDVKTIPTPVSAPKGVTFSDLAGSYLHVCATGSNGRIYCWGNNGNGQLGIGSKEDRTTPTEVVAPAGVAFSSLTTGAFHTCALGNDSNVYCWGVDYVGQPSDGSTAQDMTTPVEVSTPAGVTFLTLVAGYGHTCALGNDDKAYCWGRGSDGQLGDGATTRRLAPGAVDVPAGVTLSDLVAGFYHTCALGSDGETYCWGQGYDGQLGNGTVDNRTSPTPVRVPAGVTFSGLTAGTFHTCALGSDSKTYCWGNGDNGRLGDGFINQRLTPTEVSVPAGVTFSNLSAGYRHTCALSSDGKVYCWGAGDSGRLGNGSTRSELTPTPVREPH